MYQGNLFWFLRYRTRKYYKFATALLLRGTSAKMDVCTEQAMATLKRELLTKATYDGLSTQGRLAHFIEEDGPTWRETSTGKSQLGPCWHWSGVVVWLLQPNSSLVWRISLGCTHLHPQTNSVLVPVDTGPGVAFWLLLPKSSSVWCILSNFVFTRPQTDTTLVHIGTDPGVVFWLLLPNLSSVGHTLSNFVHLPARTNSILVSTTKLKGLLCVDTVFYCWLSHPNSNLFWQSTPKTTHEWLYFKGNWSGRHHYKSSALVIVTKTNIVWRAADPTCIRLSAIGFCFGGGKHQNHMLSEHQQYQSIQLGCKW